MILINFLFKPPKIIYLIVYNDYMEYLFSFGLHLGYTWLSLKKFRLK